mmetsp:Transcript_29593/g.76456  ORF Transcript_29593/g.76456 Transcript_29593/m.76456 type:complete len:223 (-) Transcript_29593:172-840(-)
MRRCAASNAASSARGSAAAFFFNLLELPLLPALLFFLSGRWAYFSASVASRDSCRCDCRERSAVRSASSLPPAPPSPSSRASSSASSASLAALRLRASLRAAGSDSKALNLRSMPAATSARTISRKRGSSSWVLHIMRSMMPPMSPLAARYASRRSATSSSDPRYSAARASMRSVVTRVKKSRQKSYHCFSPCDGPSSIIPAASYTFRLSGSRSVLYARPRA